MKIIKIGASWCPACLIVNNTLNKIQSIYNIDIENLDYDFDEEIVSKYDVGDILPVLIFFDNGKEVERLIGERKFEEIEGVIKKYEKD